MAKQPTTSQPLSHHLGRKILLILCALVPLIMHTGIYNFALLPKRLIVQIGLVVIALFWLRDLRNQHDRLYKSPLYLPLGLYLILSIVSITQAVNPLSSLVALSHQITFAFLFLIAAHVFPISAMMTFFRISAGIGIFVSLIGICEARGIEGWLPLSNGRPSATFAYRNFAAAFLILNIPLAIALVLKSRNTIDTYVGIISIAFMFTFLIYTRTRGAWVGLFGASIVVIALILLTRPSLSLTHTLHNRTVQLTALIALVLTITLSALPPNIASQQSRAIDEKKAELLDALSFASTPQADRGRLAMWRHTLEMIGDHPVLGIGIGNWRHIYPRYDGGDMLRADSAPERPHNDYLGVASETGIPSLIVYIGFLITIAVVLLRILKNPAHTDHPLFALVFATGILAMLGHSVVSFPNERVETSFLFWFGLGILAKLDPGRSPATKSPILQFAVHLVPALLILGMYLTYRHMQFDRHYLRAFEYYRGGDMRGVLQESTKALQWGAFDTQAFLLQGNAYQAAGMIDNAQTAYQQGLETSPNNIQLLGALGNAYALTDQLDKAENLYRQALAIYPGYYEMDNNIGGIYQKRGDLQNAIEAYKRVIQKSGGYIDAYTNLGLAYVATDSTAQAIKAYENALRLAPNDPVIYHDLGEAYYQHARKDPNALPIAQKAFERFLQYWKGPAADTQKARQRLSDIQKRLNP